VASPDDPRPEGTGKTAERQERNAPEQTEVVDPVQIAQRRQKSAPFSGLLAADQTVLDQVDQAGAGGDCEKGLARNGEDDMGSDQKSAQYRRSMDIAAEADGGDHHQQADGGREERSQDARFRLHLQQQIDGRHHPGEHGQGIVKADDHRLSG